MGRKRKTPVVLNKDEVSSEFYPACKDGLPKFVNYFDAKFEKDIGDSHHFPIRVFLKKPTHEEIKQTVALYKSSKKRLVVINGDMPYNKIKHLVNKSLYDYIITLGFNANFSINICRIIIKKYADSNKSNITISTSISGVKEFIKFLKSKNIDLKSFSISNITSDHWIDFSIRMGKDKRKSACNVFNKAREVFILYKPTSLNGRLADIKCSFKNNNIPKEEHTSEFFSDKSYSDAELYQMIAVFLSFIFNHTKARKEFEKLSEEDMPRNWLTSEKIEAYRNSTVKEKKVLAAILANFVTTKNDDLIIKHALIWDKLYKKSFLKILEVHTSYKSKPMIKDFNARVQNKYGIIKGHPHTFIDLCSNNHKDHFRHHHAFCLSNLLMLYTGCNKGTVLTCQVVCVLRH